ncbi:hypothetical protein CC80DRAFT_585957 [Byssothecium circinans]|uniref:Uncharacterized protein n=1 Tax=Byssothecium circinans TaxID=147558 RepID=A0A6A5U2S4_9PLEO|nr:hypothetical protein CC80DRAFT_585957 [Byssothecium circinans]
MDAPKPQVPQGFTDPSTSKEAITLRNQKESPLLRLPGELRNRIYRYALSGITINLYKGDGNKFSTKSISHGAHILGLAKVCRQIHAEIDPLLVYRANTFRVDLQNYSALGDFVKSLKAKPLAAIETVCIPMTQCFEGLKIPNHWITAHGLSIQLLGLSKLLIETEIVDSFVGKGMDPSRGHIIELASEGAFKMLGKDNFEIDILSAEGKCFYHRAVDGTIFSYLEDCAQQ